MRKTLVMRILQDACCFRVPDVDNAFQMNSVPNDRGE
jgi:hypothetical protein